MKYIPNAMQCGTQRRSHLFILSMISVNWPEIKKLDRFGLKLSMCSNFYEIWYLVQIEHANNEHGTWNWWSWPKIIDSGKFCTHITKFGTHNKWNMLAMNVILAMVCSARVISGSEQRYYIYLRCSEWLSVAKFDSHSEHD